MLYRQRRRLRGVAVVKVTVTLSVESYEALQRMKGTLGNGAAIERLIAEKQGRMTRRAELRGRAN